MRQTLTFTTCVLLMLGSTCLGAARPDVLNMIPSDSAVVIVTQPLAKVTQQVNTFIQRLGVPMENPVDIATLAGGQLGLGSEIDVNRACGLAIGNLELPQETLLAFVPVAKNAELVMGQLAATGGARPTATAGILQLPTGGVFAKASGQYIVVGGSEALLQQLGSKPLGVKLSDAEMSLLDTSLAACKLEMASAVKGGQEAMMTAMNMNPQMQTMPGTKDMFTTMFTLLAEADTLFAGIGVRTDGIGISSLLTAKPGTELAQMLSDHPTTGIAPLNALPAKPFLVASVANLRGSALAGLTDRLIEPMIASAGDAVTADEQSQIKQIILETMKQYRAGAYAEYVSPMTPAGGPGPKKIMGMFGCTDSARMMVLAKQSMPLMTKVMQHYAKMAMSYNDAAGQIAGRDYAEFTVDFSTMDMPPESLEAMKAQFGGETTMTEQLCAVDKNNIAIGVGPDSLAELLNSVDSGQGGLGEDPAIVQAARNLPSQANVYAFMPIGNMVRQALSQPNTPPQAMMMAGSFMQIQSAIGGSATLADGMVRTDAFIPNEPLQAAAMFVQMMMGAMGGPGAGPGMGPGGPQPAAQPANSAQP